MIRIRRNMIVIEIITTMVNLLGEFITIVLRFYYGDRNTVSLSVVSIDVKIDGLVAHYFFRGRYVDLKLTLIHPFHSSYTDDTLVRIFPESFCPICTTQGRENDYL